MLQNIFLKQCFGNFLKIASVMFFEANSVFEASFSLFNKSEAASNKCFTNYASESCFKKFFFHNLSLQGMSAHLGSVFRHRFRFSGKHHPHHHKLRRALNLRYYEAYLTFLYIGIKTLFLANVSMQVID